MGHLLVHSFRALPMTRFLTECWSAHTKSQSRLTGVQSSPMPFGKKKFFHSRCSRPVGEIITLHRTGRSNDKVLVNGVTEKLGISTLRLLCSVRHNIVRGGDTTISQTSRLARTPQTGWVFGVSRYAAFRGARRCHRGTRTNPCCA